MTTVASRECWLQAIGDQHQLVVFKSPMLREDDPWLDPVKSHIAEHGLELADQETVTDAQMMFGRGELSWYMSRAALRDGLLSYGSDPIGQVSPLRALWDELSR